MRHIYIYIIILLTTLLSCEKVEEQTSKQEKPTITFRDFVNKFKEGSLPFVVPQKEWYDKYSKAIGVEFYDTFIVGKLFGKQPNTAYAFYARLKHNNFIPLIIVQERKNGSYFWLFTITNKEPYNIIDSTLIAFNRVSETELDHQTATINPDFSIDATRKLHITNIPESKEVLAKQGIQTINKEFVYKWQVNTNGKIEKVSSN